MLDEIKNLLVIQDRDQRIQELKRELERLPLEAEMARQKLEGDQKRADKVHKQIQENEVAIKNLELEVETRRDSIAKLKVQQFQTKKNNEFQAMGQEIERYGEEVTQLEDQELELMEKGEELKSQLEQAREALAATQGIVDEELAQIEERRQNSEQTVNEIESDRSELAKSIDDTQLNLYDRLFAKKGDGFGI